MEKHYVDSGLTFTCQNCRCFTFFGYTRSSIMLYGCSISRKIEYEINDGDCPLTFDDYRVVNWKFKNYSI